MHSETSNGNGVSEYPPAVIQEPDAVGAVPPTTEQIAESLKCQIENELTEVQRIVKAFKRAQAYEVANAFLCDARSLARAGKVELAERKLKAARTVLAESDDE